MTALFSNPPPRRKPWTRQDSVRVVRQKHATEDAVLAFKFQQRISALKEEANTIYDPVRRRAALDRIRQMQKKGVIEHDHQGNN